MTTKFRAARAVPPKIQTWWTSLDAPWKALLTLSAVFAFGLTTATAFGQQLQLPERVLRLETWREQSEPQLRYLVCRSIESDAGRDPRPCIYLLNDPETYLVPRPGGR